MVSSIKINRELNPYKNNWIKDSKIIVSNKIAWKGYMSKMGLKMALKRICFKNCNKF